MQPYSDILSSSRDHMERSPSRHKLPIVDGHLDIAENVTLFGRDLTTSVAEIRMRERRTNRQATVSLDELERGGIAVVLATVTPGFLAADVGADFEPQSALVDFAMSPAGQAIMARRPAPVR